jgi:hypothetical protein
MFLDNLSKMQKTGSIDWGTHPKLEWEYVITVSKKTYGPNFNLSCKMGNYALFVVAYLDQKEHGFWALTNTCPNP